MTARPDRETAAPAEPRPTHAPPPPVDRRAVVAGGAVLGLLGLVAVGLIAIVALGRSGPLAAPKASPGDFSYAVVRDAPPLELTDQDGRPFALTSLRGAPALVFFGYTHCPDVCPATVGIIDEALAAVGPGPRVVFTSIDPERDDVAAMHSYVKYLPRAYVGLSGSPAEVRTAADAWGVKYAKVETGSEAAYSMAHTADVYLVDAQGRLRAHFPFGTQAPAMEASLRALLAEPATASTAPLPPSPSASAAPASTAPATPVASMGTGSTLAVQLVSSSVWAGGGSPVILAIADSAGTPLDGTTGIDARVVSLVDGSVAGPDVAAVPVRPPGLTAVSYVATLDFPSPGPWRVDLVASNGAAGSVRVTALDPGATAALGAPAPDVHTPTLDDVNGVALAITTVPDPDLRFSQTSTTQARATGTPYVLVIDSARFKVTQACGRALAMTRYLLDRWPQVVFIHLEPFEYQIITSEPVLSGDIANPPLNRSTRAWGIGDATWTALNMPWVFVVDGSGIVRAKYTGIVGSADVDVILSQLTGQGLLGGS